LAELKLRLCDQLTFEWKISETREAWIEREIVRLDADALKRARKL
jgi:hypothetical protein